jgi:hypothetical protein
MACMQEEAERSWSDARIELTTLNNRPIWSAPAGQIAGIQMAPGLPTGRQVTFCLMPR